MGDEEGPKRFVGFCSVLMQGTNLQVSMSKTQNKSAQLERQVKDWCETKGAAR